VNVKKLEFKVQVTDSVGEVSCRGGDLQCVVSRASYYIKAFTYCLLYQFLLSYSLETAGKIHTLGKKCAVFCFLYKIRLLICLVFI